MPTLDPPQMSQAGARARRTHDSPLRLRAKGWMCEHLPEICGAPRAFELVDRRLRSASVDSERQ